MNITCPACSSRVNVEIKPCVLPLCPICKTTIMRLTFTDDSVNDMTSKLEAIYAIGNLAGHTSKVTPPDNYRKYLISPMCKWCNDTGMIRDNSTPSMSRCPMCKIGQTETPKDTTGESDMSSGKDSVSATTRKLKTTWSLEAAQDLKSVHNIDAEGTLTDVMADGDFSRIKVQSPINKKQCKIGQLGNRKIMI